MEQVGQAALNRQPPPPKALERIRAAAAKAPLLPEPYVIRGITAQLAGNPALAERALIQARARGPREAAPRYFLAQYYMTNGRNEEGLREIAVLARVLPGGVYAMAPLVASYLRSSGMTPALREVFDGQPALRDAVLLDLAGDARNTDLILGLSPPRRKADGTLPDWVPRLVTTLVDAGQYQRAQRIWSAGTGLKVSPGAIFNSEFRKINAPPPFNWLFAPTGIGIAEPQGGGALHVLYYGREDGPLASQLLLLKPGRYRLSLQVSGATARASSLKWSVTCLPVRKPALELVLGRASANGVLGGEFEIPGDCSAQLLSLTGAAAELPQEVDVTITKLALARVGA